MSVKFKWETEFKETEIGEIPKDWEVKKLGIVADVIRGVSFKQKEAKFEKFENSIPILRANNISEKGELIWEELMFISKDKIHPKQFLKKHDIIMVASSGSKRLVGKLFQLKKEPQEKCSFGAFLYCIRPKDNLKYNKKLLGFVLDSPLTKRRLEEVVDGTNINNLRKSDLENMKLIYPPPPEQSRIATVLSWFDNLIENKKRQNEILEKVAMAIFKSWFVDFEPFKDEEFVYNEELGKEIPKGWKVKPIGEVADFVKGLSYRSNELVNNPTEGEIFITLKIFKRGGGFRPEYKYYKGNRYSEEQVVYDGDLVIALTDMTSDAKVVGAPALVILPPDRNKGILSLDAVKLNTPQYMKEYVYLYLKDSQEENSTFANGVNVLHLNLNLFKVGKFILIPPQPIIQRFHSLVEPLFQKIILNQKQIMVLRKIRDTLLPKLVFGKLRVEEI